MRLRRVLIAVLVIAPLLAILGYGFFRDARYIPSPIVGRAAPPFSLTLLNGDKLTLADLRGKVVFVNFWASWCPPCIAEAKDLEATWRGLKERGVVFVGVEIQDTEANGRAFVAGNGITYPVGIDAQGRIAIDYGVWGVPESFFIDADGQIGRASCRERV